MHVLTSTPALALVINLEYLAVKQAFEQSVHVLELLWLVCGWLG